MALAEHPTRYGIVVRRPPRSHGGDPFFSGLVEGMDSVLVPEGRGVLLRIASDLDEELDTYRLWARTGAIAGVVIGDLVADDVRPSVASSLGLVSVTLGDRVAGHGGPSIEVDNAAPMRDAITHLANLGHRVLGRVAGPAQLRHTVERDRAFDGALRARGLTGRSVTSDYSTPSGARAVAELLGDPQPPTAILFDNDLTALGGLEAARRLGVPVPDALSLLAWDDSELCRMAQPPLSVMSRDVLELGRLVALALDAAIDGRTSSVRASSGPGATGSVCGAAPAPSVPRIVDRGTTARAPR